MRRTLIFIGICLLARTVEAQVPSDSALSHQIDALAQKTLKLPVAGVSVAIAHDGRVVFAKGYGLANVEHSVPVRPETVFHIDSISKNILAAVILRLVEQGKLSLSDDVTKYVPEAPTHGRHVTVRQLLDQTSGIYSFTSLPNADDNERLDLNRNQVLALIKDKPPLFEPGTSWRYDNSAFYIAGMVVESATKREYAEYVRDEVFGPPGYVLCSTL